MSPTAGSSSVKNDTITSPEALDEMVDTTKPGAWIAMACVIVLVVVAGIWSVTAQIPQEVKTSGTIVTPGDVIEVTAPVNGTIARLPLVTVGGSVEAGETLYTIQPPGSAAPVEVKSPVRGQIPATAFRLGTAVEQGHVLTNVTIAGRDEYNFVAATMPQLDALKFPVGSTVYVAPVTTDLEVNGSMVGQVLSHSQPPASSESSQGSSFGGPTFTVVIGLGNSPQWTGQRPDFQPAEGTEVTVTRVVAEPHPIQLLFGG